MKLLIEISKEDFDSINKTEMTVKDLYETVQGRVYRAIVNGVYANKENKKEIKKIKNNKCEGCSYNQRCTDPSTGRECNCTRQICIYD